MIEKLVIKNFGPIKEANLVIRKVNILIGNQGTGKSSIAKLLSIFNTMDFLADLSTFNNCLKNYSLNSFLKKNTYLKYTSNNLTFSLEYKNGEIKFLKKSKFFTRLIVKYSKLKNRVNSLDSSSVEELIEELKNINEVVKYVPTERSLIPIISNSLFSLLTSETNIPQYLLRFGEVYEFSRNSIEKIRFDFLDIQYEYNKTSGDTIVLSNKHRIKLTESASGFQSLVPLLLAVESINNDKSVGSPFSLVIEEPELNLFPSTQYELLKHILSRSSRIRRLIITTHSPYILTSLNNLLQAYNVGSQKGKSTKVSQIIRKDIWLDFKEVSAYMILSNGKAINIMDNADKLTKVDMIDEVSTVINKEFDELLRLHLGLKKLI